MFLQKSRCVPPTLEKPSASKEKESIGSNSSRGASVLEMSSLSRERKVKLKELEFSVEKIKTNYERKEMEFLRCNGLNEECDDKDRIDRDRKMLRITKDKLSILNDKFLGGKNGLSLINDSNSDCRSLFTANSGSENSIRSSSSSFLYVEKDNNLVSDFDAESEGGKIESITEINENENENNEVEKLNGNFTEIFARNNRFRFQDSSEISEERVRSPPIQRSPSRVAMIEVILKNYNYYETDDLIANVGKSDLKAPNHHISNERKRWDTETPNNIKGGQCDRIWSMKSYSNSNSSRNSNSISNRSHMKDTVIGSFAWQIPLIKIRSTYLLQKAMNHRQHRRVASESNTSNHNNNNNNNNFSYSNTHDQSNNNSNHSNSFKSCYNNNNSIKSNRSNKSGTFNNNYHNNNNNNNIDNNNNKNHWSILEGSSSESQCKNDIIVNHNKSSPGGTINRCEKEAKHTDPSRSSPRISSTIKIPSTVCAVS